MKSFEMRKPPATVTSGAPGANIRPSAHYHSADCRRLPPYAKTLISGRRGTLVVLTGSRGWERAKSPCWFPGSKIVLPPGGQPGGFDWSVAAGFSDSILFAAGEPEPADTIMALASELLRHIPLVLYVGPGPVIKFEARREAA
jgi:hypothetical protein